MLVVVALAADYGKSNLCALHLNLALCAGKAGQHGGARAHATIVLGAVDRAEVIHDLSLR